MSNALLYYECLAEFKKQLYAGILEESDIVGGETHIATFTHENGFKDTEANFWGYVFAKNNNKYLLPTRLEDGSRINIQDVLPFKPLRTTKVAYKGQAYQMIEDKAPIVFRAKRTMSFRELVDSLGCFAHQNPRHYKLLWLIELTQILDRANFRIVSPPGFGKDSVVDVMRGLNQNAGTIENPTIAKLEERAKRVKHLALNEVIDITKDQWRQIEQFLLAAGANKTELTKRSRAHGGVGETIDVSTLSLTLMYNDIMDYSGTLKDYFDGYTKRAVQDRFVPFRLYGRLTENFNAVRDLNVPDFVSENMTKLKEFIYNLEYYRAFYAQTSTRYDTSTLCYLPERWKLNVQKLLKTVSFYVESQEEMDEWVDTIGQSIQDYKLMLKFPEVLEKLKKRKGLKEQELVMKALDDIPTYKDKIAHIDKVLNQETVIDNIEVDIL